ncbi:FAD-dependent oxidoreductase [Pacificispira sp.]|uniref:FAD-dependent oxidoreductase n=1 Tax=Pacificispira sp. TaxID=2888761 RepID=UPI003B526D0D
MAWLRVAALEEVRDKEILPLTVDGQRIALYWLDGEVFAIGDVCTHQVAILSDGFVEDGCIECPLHQGRFCVRTGKAQGAPVTEDLPTFLTKVEDGAVFVDPDLPAAVTADAGLESEAPESDAPGPVESAPDNRCMVIVGAGQAGGRAAEAARKAGYAGKLVLIGDEPTAPYERPPLSKGILTGEASEKDLLLFSPEELNRLALDFRPGLTVRGIDRDARQLTLGDGTVLGYDGLLLATGARPRRLEIDGGDLKGVLYLRSHADAQILKQALGAAQAVAIVGGGFIGLEVASTAAAAGKRVTVLERDARLVSRILPSEISEDLAGRARAAGVDIRTGVDVAGFDGSDGTVSAVKLASGETVPADLVIVGVGAIPNVELAREAGLSVDGGIVVDATGRTSDPAIFAAGDVANYPHAPNGGPMRLESWQNAQDQAAAAGRSLVGAETRYEGVPWFWSDQFGLNIQILGIPDPHGAVRRRGGAEEGPSAWFQINPDNTLRAVFAFSDAAAIREGRNLMSRGDTVPEDMFETRQSDSRPEGCIGKAVTPATAPVPYIWPEGGLNRIPDWVYTSDEIYQREVERIFHGRSWNYVALEAEIPEPGQFVRSFVGPTPVVVVRGEDGAVNVFENRCAHRAAEFCREQRGKVTEFVCPYHQWTYDLEGNLSGVPFRRGVGGKGGMAKDFDPTQHGIRKLNVTTRRGVVFASFHDDMESIEEYMGPEILTDFDATFDGRKLTILGYYRNTVPGNWKLYHENLKDPYHATLLHTFLVTFGLLVAGNKSAMIADATGRHGTMASAKSDGKTVDSAAKSEMRAYRDGMVLNEPKFMDFIPEFDSPWSVTMQTIWPNLIVQREMNTLGVRQIVPKGPNEFVMNWTMFGYEGDDEEMTRHRLRQGNLMGPAGFLGLEDNEAMKFVQDGMLRGNDGEHLVALDPETPTGTSDTLISESAIRGMYAYWRKEMGL